MKSKLFLSLFCLFSVIRTAHCTEQQPDILLYNSFKLKLETGWGHPSPLETYYLQNDIEYPFTMLHTANYRGYVATWKVTDGKLYITKIETNENNHSPIQYGLVSKDKSMSSKDKVYADWFSGILVCNRTKKQSWKVIETYYFHVLNGEIQSIEVIDETDKLRIQELTEKDTSDVRLMSKYRMLVLNEKYITFYYRINAKDTVFVGKNQGYFNRKKAGSPILSYFSDDHLEWPFNWMNLKKSGAPNCKWTIRNDSIFLTEIGLLSNLSFYTVDKEIVTLNETLSVEDQTDEIFANWIDGVFVVEYGKEIERDDLAGYKEFKPSEFVYYRISQGLILESETVSSTFNFREIPEDTPEDLKKLIDDY